MKNILYYKYVLIDNLKTFRKEHLALCKSLGLKGKVLIAEEGINGCLSGEDKDIQEYMDALHKDKRFADMLFRQGKTKNHTFKRMHIKIRKEIITSKFTIDIKDKASYIEPTALKELLDKGEDVVLIDARNDYECKMGMFKNAHNPKLRTFNQFKSVAKKYAHLKDKQIITYCTGGVRCEKASAYLISQGFSKVKQLHGGIIQYGIDCGDAHWDGKCFVFDRRGAIEIAPEKQETDYKQCSVCFVPSENKHICQHCQEEFIACEDCSPLYNDCCSKFCRNSLQERNN